MDGPAWQAKRDVARINGMARAGRRVSEALALRSGYGELCPVGGSWLVKAGKRLKARRPPPAVEARAALQANLKVRPQVADDRLFLSRTLVALDSRDVQRLVSEAARRIGLKIKVTSHMLRHNFVTKSLERNQGDIATLATILGHTNISTPTRSCPAAA